VTVDNFNRSNWDIVDLSRLSFWFWDITFWWRDSSFSTNDTVIWHVFTDGTFFVTIWTGWWRVQVTVWTDARWWEFSTT